MKRKAFVSLFTPSNVNYECAINSYRFMFEIERADHRDSEGNELKYFLDMQSQEARTQDVTLSNKEHGTNQPNNNCADRESNRVFDPVKLPGEKSFYKKSARAKRAKNHFKF